MAAIITLRHSRRAHPAPSAFHGFAQGLATVVMAALRAPARFYANRRLTNQLGQMSEFQLRDIGLSRQDVADGAAQPFLPDAGSFLAARADERKAWRHAR